MAYVAPIHRPSSVRHALRIKLLSAEEECLVVSKANRLEIWRFGGAAPDELVLFHAQRVYGTVSMLEALRPKDAETELLFVGTDRFDYVTLGWDAARQRLQTVDRFHDVGEKHLRDAQSQDRCAVDPSGRFLALLLWEGVLSVLRMKARRDRSGKPLEWMDQVRLSELFVKAAAFLHTETGHPRIAFLYQSRADRFDAKLAVYRLTSDDRDEKASHFDPHRDRELHLDLDDDPGAAMLIPVEPSEAGDRRHNVRRTTSHAASGAGDGGGGSRGGGGGGGGGGSASTPLKPHLGGLLVVGETRLLYMDDTTQATVAAPLRTPAVFVAWARYDRTHYFLADDVGVLRLLTLLTDGPVVTRLDVQAIGVTSRASALVYVPDRRLLFVGSHHGDSQLYRIHLDGGGGEAMAVDAPEAAGAGTGADAGAGAGAGTGTGGQPAGSRYCELVQVFSNIAPILDFAVMDMGNREDDAQLANEYASGQARIVTASGVHKDGSLRSVRSGVGLEDLGVLDELAGARALFSLRLRPAAATAPPRQVDTLVVSFLTETRVFVFDADGGIEEVDRLPGADLGAETLWSANVGGGGVLHITPHAVTVADVAGDGTAAARWTPPPGQTITSASANDRWVLLSVEGTRLVSLSLRPADGELLRVAADKDFGADQIACLHASPQLVDTGVVGTWTAGAVTLVDLATLQPTQTSVSVRSREDTASVPRSLALVQVLPQKTSGGGPGPTLFVAMDDGTVVTFAVAAAERRLLGRKSVVLGTRHANLHLLPQAAAAAAAERGTYQVFATTEHPSLIYGSAEGRIVYAAVTAQDAHAVCAFDAAAFPGAIVVATRRQIQLARPDAQKQTHVQTVPVGASVRRLAYAPGEKVFALGCVAVDVVRGREEAACSVRLVDDVLFQPVGRPLPLDAARGELVESVVRAELRDSQGELAERFLVGTSYVVDASAASAGGSRSAEPVGLGRVLVVGIDAERNPYVISSHRMRGPCRCLAVVDGKIVLGLSKTVVLSEYVETSSMSGTLRKLASFRAATFVVDLAVHGRCIAVGDMMKSTTIVEYIPASTPGGEGEGEGEGDGDGEQDKPAAATPAQLVGRARDYQASWTTAVCPLADEAWLAADAHGNLSVLQRNADGLTAEDQRRLRTTSELNLGEMVNRIRPIAVESSPHAMVHPKAFLATVEGSIYLFGTVAANVQDMLMQLQARLAATVQGVGEMSFMAYRGFRNQEREAEEPFRFLDGELLERFLDLDEAAQAEVAQGLGPSVEDLRNSIEELKRMH